MDRRQMRTYLERLRDDHGSVGVLIALVLFTVVGMLCMTFNTAQLSKEKMRLQNAADSAALEHAIWQARAMNALQNLNDEGYVTCQTADVCLKVGAGLEIAAKACDHLPIVGWVFAGIFRVGAVMSAGVSAIMANIVLRFAIPISSFFFARVAVPIGYFAAQQYAYANGATPILPGIKLGGPVFGDMSLGFFAVGVSPSAPLTTFLLPVVARSMRIRPYKSRNSAWQIVFKFSPWRTIYRALRVAEDWDFKPYVSRGGYYDKFANEASGADGTGDAANDENDAASAEPVLANTDDALERRILEGVANRRREILDCRAESVRINAELGAVAKIEESARVENRALTDAETARKKTAEEALEKLTSKLTEKKLDIRADVDGVDWNREARARVCAALKISDPAKDRAVAKEKDSDAVRSPVLPKKHNPKLPGATIWVAFKARKSIHVVPLSVWSEKYKPKGSDSGLDRCPMIAIAAAKCITGDLIPHNKKSKTGKVNQRPSGFGVGANAKLVPVQRALAEIGGGANVLSKAVGSVIFH